jgi:hypothetical protein
MAGKLASAPFQCQTNLFHGVLIEEDNEVIRRVNAEVLIRSGCEVNVYEQKRPRQTGVVGLLKTPSRQQKLLGN